MDPREACQSCMYAKVHRCARCGLQVCRVVIDEMKAGKARGFGTEGACVILGHYAAGPGLESILCVDCKGKGRGC